MTETASKELCAELYKLTGWGYGETDKVWCHGKLKNKGLIDTREVHEHHPAYSCGYLLRKLPKQIKYVGGSPAAVWWNQKTGKWQTGYTRNVQGSDDNTKSKIFNGDTPEDALTKLAIELVKQGIVPKEQK